MEWSSDSAEFVDNDRFVRSLPSSIPVLVWDEFLFQKFDICKLFHLHYAVEFLFIESWFLAISLESLIGIHETVETYCSEQFHEHIF